MRIEYDFFVKPVEFQKEEVFTFKTKVIPQLQLNNFHINFV